MFKKRYQSADKQIREITKLTDELIKATSTGSQNAIVHPSIEVDLPIESQGVDGGLGRTFL